MKIGLVTEALGSYVSGGINFIVNILNALTAQGHDASLFLLKSPYTSEWLEAKFPIYPINSSEFEDFDGVLSAEFSPIAKIVADHKNSQDRLLHVHTNEALFGQWNGPEWQKMAQESYSLPLKIYCTSTYLQILMEMMYGRNVIGTLVPPGIDERIFNLQGRTRLSYDNSGPLNICVFGRQDSFRGLNIAIQGIMAAQINIPIKLEVIPEGTRSQEVIASYYKRADLFIDTSLVAGSPTPPKEAMACGALPIVTPYGTQDYVYDGSNGFIIPPRRADMVEKAIITYYKTNLETRCHMHEYARHIASLYTWDIVANRLLNAIEEASLRSDLLEPKKWI